MYLDEKANRDSVSDYGVSAYPTFILMRDGAKVEQIAGKCSNASCPHELSSGRKPLQNISVAHSHQNISVTHARPARTGYNQQKLKTAILNSARYNTRAPSAPVLGLINAATTASAASAASAGIYSPAAGVVQFLANDGSWQHYGAAAVAQVRVAFLAGKKGVDIGKYWVDLKAQPPVQVNKSTKFKVRVGSGPVEWEIILCTGEHPSYTTNRPSEPWVGC